MKGHLRRFWQEEEAQGATEYILILVVVVGLAMVFREKITEVVSEKVEQLGGDISKFTN